MPATSFSGLIKQGGGSVIAVPTIPSAPVISGLSIVNVTDTTFDVNWSTTTLSDSEICHEVTTWAQGGPWNTCITDAALVTSHTVNVTGLSPLTTYYFKASSTDNYSQTGLSAEQSQQTIDTPPAPSTDPTLPTSTVDTTLPWTIGSQPGTAINVTNCNTSGAGSLSAAIAAAVSGDEIIIDYTLDCTYTTAFTLPKVTSGWVIIRTSGYASISAEGTRIDPTLHVSYMPRLTLNGTSNFFQPAVQARGYRFIGLELRYGVGVTTANSLISVDPVSIFQQSDAASDIIVDRCWLHSDPLASTRHMVRAGGIGLAIIDSYVVDAKDVNAEAQAILGGWTGPGPFLIRNNYISAAGEQVMFGGVNPSYSTAMSYDITVNKNHMQNQLYWFPQMPQYFGRVGANGFTRKNLFEIKCGSRVDVDGNVFEYKMNNDGGQQQAIVIKRAKTVSGAANNVCEANDVWFRNNVVRHSNGGFQYGGGREYADANDFDGLVHSERVKVSNNLWDDITSSPWDINGAHTVHAISAKAYTHKFTFDHNTYANSSTGSCMTPLSTVAGFLPDTRLTNTLGQPDNTRNTTQQMFIRNNYFCMGKFITSGGGEGDTPPVPSFARVEDPALPITYSKNLLAGSDCSAYSGHYTCGADSTVFFKSLASSYAADFTDQPNGDFRILAGSNLHNAGTDGTDIGINDWTKIPACAPYTYAGAYCPVVPLANPITATSIVGPIVCNGTNTTTIAGTNFKRGTQVVFDASNGAQVLLREENATLTVDSAIQLTIKPPVRAAGSYKVFPIYATMLAGSNTDNLSAGSYLTLTCS